MRKVRKGLFVTLSGMIIVILAAGTAWAQSASAKASASAAPSGTAGGTFIEGTINDMRTVNPWKAIESPEYEVLALNFDLLENFDKSTLQASPGVATSWTQSPDGLSWTFDIRQGMTWQDGQPFTANDIAFTYNKTIDCNLGNSLDYLVPDFTESITAPSPTQLVWTTNKPTSAPIRPPWVYIAPEHIWGKSSLRRHQEGAVLRRRQADGRQRPVPADGVEQGPGLDDDREPELLGRRAAHQPVQGRAVRQLRGDGHRPQAG